jgi:hypothetical protein
MMPPGGLRHIGWRLIHPSADLFDSEQELVLVQMRGKLIVYLWVMKRPIFVRPLSDAERQTLQEAGLRSSDAFVLRRCLQS